MDAVKGRKYYLQKSKGMHWEDRKKNYFKYSVLLWRDSGFVEKNGLERSVGKMGAASSNAVGTEL